MYLDSRTNRAVGMLLSLILTETAFLHSAYAQTPAVTASEQRSQPKERIIFDPATGRRYRQQLVDVQVPTTSWQTKAVPQTFYEPQVSTRYVNVPRTVYVPHQTQVLQSRVVGLWNPFRQPRMAYEYVPVTQWVPRTQNQQVPLTSQNWVAIQRTVYVSEPVRKTKTQQQVVTTELPSVGAPSLTNPTLMYAMQPTPRVRIPLLARQQVLPSALLPSRPPTIGYPAPQSGASPTRLAAAPAQPLSAGLQPLTAAANAITGNQNRAPLRTASRAPSQMRDSLQSGMSATVLR
ncbi:MAG: hypothetical protein VXZ82_08325 [Planctomycetota bacterium]|nr:hypothetical protein [Planctomycetota bacterium]